MEPQHRNAGMTGMRQSGISDATDRSRLLSAKDPGEDHVDMPGVVG